MDRNKQINAGRQTVKRKYKFISFSSKVGPYVSFVETMTEYKNGNVGCGFSFVINKKYDMKKHGSKRICIDLQKLRGRKPSC